jgi:hypothetical protein
MAAMDIRKARALAEQLIMSGQNDGLTREDLVQQIIAKAEGAGAPGTAIGAALMGAQPQTVTPATPAPMQPGVQLVAPKPTAQLMPTPRPPPMAPPQAAPPQAPQPQAQELPVAAAPQQAAPERPAPQSSYRQALASTREQIAQVQTALAAMPTGQDNILERTRLQTSLQILNERAANLEGEALATENAQLPEEIRAALANQEARLGRREERLQQAQGRTVSDALLAGGAALAQGRDGESLVEALSRGLQAGTQQYDRSRQQIEEGTENIGEARDAVVIKRYEALKQAQKEARDIIRSGREYDEKTLALANLTDDLTQKIATGQSTLEVAKGRAALVKPTLDTALANAKEAGIKAESAQAIINASIERDLASAAYARGLGRQPAGDGDKVDVEKRMAKQALQALADDYDAAAAVYNAALRENGMMASMVPAEVKSALLAAQAKLKSRSSSYARTYGSSPFMQNERPRATSKTTAAPSGVINLGKIG